MDTIIVAGPSAMRLVVAAEVDPHTTGPDRILAVVALGDDGAHHHACVHPPADITCPLLGRLLARATPADAGQLTLPLDPPGLPAPSASGRTWRSWLLPSIPTGLRHLPPDRLVVALAHQLSRPGQPSEPGAAR